MNFLETLSGKITKIKTRILSLTKKRKPSAKEIAEKNRLKISHTVYPENWVDREIR